VSSSAEEQPDQAPSDSIGGDDTIGAMIRRQRELAELSMRQLADMAGISNPYLSQIERGLRAPSEQVLSALADSLQLSADLLREPTAEATESRRVIEAINAEPDLTASQKRSLIETYQAFRQLTIDRRRTRTSPRKIL
jgi:transcriptional regulator with XRE-family HTH domain